MSSLTSFYDQKMEGAKERNIYRKKLADSIIQTNEGKIAIPQSSIDAVTDVSSGSDAMTALPIYKNLNDPSVGGPINSQILDMVNKSRQNAVDPNVLKVPLTPEEKAKNYQLRMYIEELKKGQKLS